MMQMPQPPPFTGLVKEIKSYRHGAKTVTPLGCTLDKVFEQRFAVILPSKGATYMRKLEDGSTTDRVHYQYPPRSRSTMPSIDVPDPDQVLEGVLLDTPISQVIDQAKAQELIARRRKIPRVYNLHPQITPQTATGDVSEAGWQLVVSLLSGQYGKSLDYTTSWAKRFLASIDAMSAAINAGKRQVWLDLEADLNADPRGVDANGQPRGCRREQWWSQRAYERYDSRAGEPSTFPKSPKAGVYLIVAFLASVLVFLYRQVHLHV